MSRLDAIRAEFVEFIPGKLETGVVYISRKYKTASHLCCCGCGTKVVTPLKPGGWQLTTKRETVTLHPSIGNWRLPCKSHYIINNSRVVWAGKWSEAQIQAGWLNDQLARQQYFDTPTKPASFGARMLRWLADLFRRK